MTLLHIVTLTGSIVLFTIAGAVLGIHMAWAADFVALTAIPGVNTDQPSLVQYINSMFRFLIGLGALFAVMRITFAGIKYMTAGAFTSKKDAIESIRESFLGLLIILATVLILQTINPNILKLDIFAGVADSVQQFNFPNPAGSTPTPLPQDPVCTGGQVLTTYPDGHRACAGPLSGVAPIWVQNDFNNAGIPIENLDTYFAYAEEMGKDPDTYVTRLENFRTSCTGSGNVVFEESVVATYCVTSMTAN